MLTINLTDVVGSSGDIGYVPYIVANDKLGNSVLRQVDTRIVNSGTYTSADGKTILSVVNGAATLGYYNSVGESFVTSDQTNLAGGYNNVATGENVYFFFDASGLLVSSATLPMNINTNALNFNGSQVAVMSDLSGFASTTDISIATFRGGSNAVSSPADSATVHAGLSMALAPNATDTLRQFKGINGTMKSCLINTDATGVVGSTESCTLKLWNVTDAVDVGTIGTFTFGARGLTFLHTGLSLAMLDTKYYTYKLEYPVFSSNPTNVYLIIEGKVF